MKSSKQLGEPISKPVTDITGVWTFLSSQPQTGSEYLPITDTVIIKFFQQGKWIHTAYQTDNKKAVFIAGGSYSFDGKELIETVEYHSKDFNAIGVITQYRVIFEGEKLQLSGTYQVAHSAPWKVEEYWQKQL